MTEYRVVDGIASTPKGQQLYDQAIAQQNAHRLANEEHTIKIAGVSNRPTRLPRAQQWYATKQDLIDNGFPTIDGIPTPITSGQASAQGYADHGDYRAYSTGDPRKGEYHKFFTWTYNNNSRQTTDDVLERQKIYRQITGKPTFAFHGCKGHSMCPQWSRSGKLVNNVKSYHPAKLNNQPVETSETMYQGLPRTSYHLQPDLEAPIPEKKPEPVFVPSIPEPEIIIEPKTISYSIPLIAGVVIVILLLLRRKNA